MTRSLIFPEIEPEIEDILRSFDGLPKVGKREVASEILRRTAALETPPLSDDKLSAIADERFLELDREEADDARAAPV
jgi:hypothetical protein